MQPILSVVLPVYNERETLEPLRSRLLPILEEVVAGSFEVVFVDDGSSDGSDRILDAQSAGDRRIKVIHLSRNFGHQAALQAGLDAATGNAVVLMDADLQDPPELLRRFVQEWRQGHEVVFAIRRNRKEGRLKRFAYASFYRTLKAMADVDVPLDAGDYCLMDRGVVDVLVGLPERNRFLRGLRSWVGFRQIGVECEREARVAGRPKYTLGKLVRLALSGYVGFSAAPLRASVWLGLATAAGGFLLGAGAVASKLLGIYSPQGWVSTIVVVMMVSGVQLLMLGVIGEYLARVYDEVRQRPLYIERSRSGFDEVTPLAARRGLASGDTRYRDQADADG